MKTTVLPDGTAATSPIYVGGQTNIPKPCPDDPGHDWLTDPLSRLPIDERVFELAGLKFTHSDMELCKKCNWCRYRFYTKGAT